MKVSNMREEFAKICIRGPPQRILLLKGEITDAKPMRTKQFGFVGYRTEQETEEAIKYFDKSFMDTRRITCEESSNSEFGIVCSDALVNPSQRISYLNTKDSGSFLGFNDQDATDQRPVCHLIDDCQKDESDRAPVSWPEELKSDWIRLSMSIPVAPSDFSSSCYPSLQKKPTVSTARLHDKLDPIQMSLDVSNDIGESFEKQLNWLPVSWGNSMGGPLGEALTSTTISVGAGTGSSSVKAYDSGPQLDSSPIGVLRKSTFVSLSNSSSGSSHSTDNMRAPENTSLPNGLGSVIPSL